MRFVSALSTVSVALVLAACGGGHGGGTSGIATSIGPSAPVAPAGTDNTVNATPSTASMTVVAGGSQTVGINFITSDGKPASGLTVSLSTLPPGWTAQGGPFSCASVTTGNGCLLNLTFSPTTQTSSGTLTLSFTYTNGIGTAKSDTVSIHYDVTTQNNVLGTAAPAGQISALVGGPAVSVALTFTTDDGKPAANLQLGNLSQAPEGLLPVDWTTASGPTFQCASVSTGNGCQLSLSFTPTQWASSSFSLPYAYTDNAGESKSGTVTINYLGATNDSVNGTALPSGTVSTAVGGSQQVTVTFNTDDGRLATNLQGSVPAMPGDWSGLSTFSCDQVSTGAGCQVTLSYSPLACETGTLSLSYTYTNDSGMSKSGTVNIPYTATAHNNATATVSPSGTISAVGNGSDAQSVQIIFATDDGNLATGFEVTSALTQLPAGWSSSSSSFTCAAIGGSSSCVLTLTYTPEAAASGTLSIGYSYTDNSGTAKTGTVSIPYSASPGVMYASSGYSLYRCTLSISGAPQNCSIQSGVPSTQFIGGLAVAGDTLYVSQNQQIWSCTLDSSSMIQSCTPTNVSNPAGPLAVYGSYLYYASVSETDVCTLSSGGSIGNCVKAGATPFTDIAVSGPMLYGVDLVTDAVSYCAIGADQMLSCTSLQMGDGWLVGMGVGVSGGNLWISAEEYDSESDDGQTGRPDISGYISHCPIANDGGLSLKACSANYPVNGFPLGIAFSGTTGYFSVASYSAYDLVCTGLGSSSAQCTPVNMPAVVEHMAFH